MTSQKVVPVLCIALLVVGLVSGSRSAWAQENRFTLPTFHGDTPEAWEPGIWGTSGISLLDAIRLALSRNPSLRLRAEDARFAEGLATEESGHFDPVLQSELSFESFRQELLDSEKKSQRDNRDGLSKDIQEISDNIALDEHILNQISRLQEDPAGLKVDDSALQAQIDLYRELISEADNSAARAELSRQLGVLLDNAHKTYADELAELRSERDQNTLRLQRLGGIPHQERSEDGKYSVQVSFPSRHGFTLYPFFQYTYHSDRYVGKRHSTDFGGKGIKDVFASQLGLGFDSPLLRGAGYASAAARETAARIGFTASVADLRHEAATTALTTALAYWEAEAAQERVSILSGAVDRQSQLVEITRSLIKGEEIPAAEISRAEARQAATRGSLEQARRDAHERQVELATAIGLELAPTRSAPAPSEEIPPPPSAAALGSLDAAALAAAAIERRDDLKSARGRLDAAGVLATAAAKDRKPRLDLTSQVWYGAREESSARAALDGSWAGPSYRAMLELEKPFSNRTQIGRYIQALATRESKGIVAADLERRIGNNLALLLGSLALAIEEVERSQQAADSYQKLLDAENERYKSGLSTLIDTLLTEEQLTDARLALVAARQRCAELVARLRFESGTLVELDDQGGEIPLRSLLTLPGAKQ